MNKPSWDDAPEWANYLAMDQDLQWCWFENEPNKILARMHGFWWNNLGKIELSKCEEIDWIETVEKRPTKIKFNDSKNGLKEIEVNEKGEICGITLQSQIPNQYLCIDEEMDSEKFIKDFIEPLSDDERNRLTSHYWLAAVDALGKATDDDREKLNTPQNPQDQ